VTQCVCMLHAYGGWRDMSCQLPQEKINLFSAASYEIRDV